MRKVRWKQTGKGKRGGVRVIYYHMTLDHQIRMLLIYPKTTQDNLTPEQVRQLRAIVERW
ncbi:type II toxin-antitoxin system RelE/ParE family toxin [Shewanella psychropiezotolerans]|uniref:type II toxin-antitoxin system RelE/ParE family toxin n=1 Tax=Shewanella psychropiezotolerans TaxID=2593655 RepID=UPI001E595172|nr:type II toxin-antitoxin system RelE/ParE family toxin [Shewanella psychropiezotolerans]